ncbi:MAG TPA: oligoendopeptidase F, partial [Anaerolineae bacterium]|nr:oligoendopeptidase F [Anaerolineae bacterium]
MSNTQIPARDQIAHEYTWNAESVFASPQAWQAEWNSIASDLPNLKKFQGHLADGASMLADALDAIDQIVRRIGKVYVYASMSHAADTQNQAASKMNSEAQGLFGQVSGAVSFLDPELIAIGEAKLRQWLKAEPRLAHIGHYIDNLFRKQAHVRSGEVEELLGMLSDPFSGISTAEGALTNADFKFAPAIDSAGKELPVTQSSVYDIMHQPDRAARRSARENYRDSYLAHKNTVAANLSTSIKQNVFMMRARQQPSTLEATLFNTNIPVEVFHNLINTFRKNLPTWQRYWRLRRKALGVDRLESYDLWAPLTTAKPKVPYPQAVEWICAGLEPMGQEYVDILRRGCLQDRWIDLLPNQGKSAGAFSTGWPGTHPFIMMSYADDVFSLSTLAHELGHSMHSYYTWKNQPTLYFDYSTFVAEVASNFHQAMVRDYLLKHNPDRDFQIALIEEALGNFLRYFFIMPTLARFELETHQRVERGEGLTADSMIDLMADLFSEGYGGEVHVDHDRVGMTWATFGHLYADYYVFQYATGISGAQALAKRVLSGEKGA